jgi:hypothetical protein
MKLMSDEVTYLPQLPNLVAQTADTSERCSSGIFQAHLVDHGIDLPRQDPHDGECGLAWPSGAMGGGRRRIAVLKMP